MMSTSLKQCGAVFVWRYVQFCSHLIRRKLLEQGWILGVRWLCKDQAAIHNTGAQKIDVLHLSNFRNLSAITYSAKSSLSFLWRRWYFASPAQLKPAFSISFPPSSSKRVCNTFAVHISARNNLAKFDTRTFRTICYTVLSELAEFTVVQQWTWSQLGSLSSMTCLRADKWWQLLVVQPYVARRWFFTAKTQQFTSTISVRTVFKPSPGQYSEHASSLKEAGVDDHPYRTQTKINWKN